MKKRWIVVAGLCVVASMVMAQSVTSVNVAGIVKVSVPAGGLAIVGINLDSIDPADANLQAVFGGKLNPGTQFDFSAADKVIMWNGTSYDVYGISNDGLFHNAYDLTTWIAAAVNPTIGPGDAFWLEDAVGDGIDVALTGQAVEDPSPDIPIAAGLQFVCYPLSAKIDIQDTSFSGTAGVGKGGAFDFSAADKIIMWNGASYDVYGLKDDNRWYDAFDLTTWIGLEVDVDLDLGVGFWYEHQLTGFTWTENNPYLANL